MVACTHQHILLIATYSSQFGHLLSSVYYRFQKMTHKSALVFHIFLVVVYSQVFYTDGLVWKDAPDEVVNVQQGSNITLRWHYEMEDNETFMYSEFLLNNSKSHALGFRHKGESQYNPISQTIKFVISGKNDVNLTVFSAELGSSNSGYCCRVIWDSNSGISRDGRCAKIFIYDPPRITSLTPQLYCKQGDHVELQCNATGYPEPRVRWINKDTKQIIGNSSVTSLNITGKRSEGSYCCDVKNRFGREIACTTVKVTDPPKFTSKMSTRYTMTTKTIKITCSATGTPKPNFTWTKENTEDVVSTGEHYEVPYVKCANKTLTFYCHASNVMGSIRSKEIQVQVITKRNCTSDSNKEIITKENNLPLILGTSCGILIAICIVVLISWKIRKIKKTSTDEDPYAEPVDTVVQSEVVLLPNRSTLPDGGYSNPEELGFPKIIKSQRPKMEEPQNETLLA